MASVGANFNKHDLPIEITHPKKELRGLIVKTFEEIDLDQQVVRNIGEIGFKSPSQIQQGSLRVILEGYDVLGCAETGSGKTAAFLLPIITDIIRRGYQTEQLEQGTPWVPLALVISPTRELTRQTYDECIKFSKNTIIQCKFVHGQMNKAFLLEQLQTCCTILFGTPGKLLHLLAEGQLSLKNLHYFVLDEADRLLDVNFQPEILKIIANDKMPPNSERQSLLFSATFKAEIQKLAIKSLKSKEYAFVHIGEVGLANTDIEQIILPCAHMQGPGLFDALVKLVQEDLGKKPKSKILVFVETSKTCQKIAEQLRNRNIDAYSMNSKVSQIKRESRFRRFKENAFPVLVATGVANRGLHVDQIDHVINYQLPQTIEEYVQRIGRTGRVGFPEGATSFYNEYRENDQKLRQDLISVLAKANNEIPQFLRGNISVRFGLGSTFEEIGFDQQVLQNIRDIGYNSPSQIQQGALRVILEGYDVLGCAETGSGKTAAFLLPIITDLIQRGYQAEPWKQGTPWAPLALIISPTRELTRQTYDEGVKFSKKTLIRCKCVHGQMKETFLSEQFQTSCTILFATPGKLLELLNKGRLCFKNLHFFVLDEADRLLDLNFQPDILKIITDYKMPPNSERQSLMFSATFARDVQKLARKCLKSNDFVFVHIGEVGLANRDIQQMILPCADIQVPGLFDALVRLIEEDLAKKPTSKILVFVERKVTCQNIAEQLEKRGIEAHSMSSKVSQKKRESRFRRFKENAFPVLVATGVANRGLHVDQIDHVINYELPQTIDEYVQRIGRTGRVGFSGRATSFYNESRSSDKKLRKKLINVLASANQEIPQFLQDNILHRFGVTRSAIKHLADGVLNMNLELDILKIIGNYKMPPNSERQSLMFSATFEREVQELAADCLKSKDYVFVHMREVLGLANIDIPQFVLPCAHVRRDN